MKYASPILFIALAVQGAGAALGATPVVDGPDSIVSSSSLIVVRERYFDIQDLSALGLLDSAGPVDQFSPDSPPPGFSDQANVQSLFVRIGWADGNADTTATLTFSPGVTILGVVADVRGRSGWIWGADPDNMPLQSQLAASADIFGVGIDYGGLPGAGLEVQGRDPYEHDGFWIDPASNAVTISGAARAGKTDDYRVIISYDNHTATGASFDVLVTAGNGLCVGASFLGDGQTFYGVPLVSGTVHLDIKPGVCPNPLIRKSRGQLQIALLGNDDPEFDVAMVDLASIALKRTDGAGGIVAPLEGPPGPHSVIEDVGTPFDSESCACHEAGGDGIADLAMKFSTPEVVEVLELDALETDSSVELAVTGRLLDGTEFEARDCLVIEK